MSTPACEEIRGIREPLPEGERVLWQGAPDWRSLAVRALHVRKLAIYFAALVALRVALAAADGESAAAAAASAVWLVALASAALGILALVAWLSARTTIYAITTGRVVMRVGIALPIVVNLPHHAIESAALRTYADGTGDLPLRLKGDVRLAYAHLWPHARPWRLRHPEPMLRSLPGAAAVAETLARALAAAAQVPVQWRATPSEQANAPAPGQPVTA
ncbi:MAG: photosynthetic complex putative assembly protein PuhB [Burkholderiales bacterium]|nr:photosynthetic complex putative assembly protein PuhB [Burkholderiales bacterium]